MNRTIAGVFLLVLLCCGPLAAQRRFTLDVTGGVRAGGLRDEMFSPLNYAPAGFAVGLGGQTERAAPFSSSLFVGRLEERPPSLFIFL